jgi:hypothetical protein
LRSPAADAAGIRSAPDEEIPMMFDVRPSALRRALLGVLLLLTALALRAQEEPARFLLEKITVAGAREAAGRIVEAETLLRAGGTYSEEEIGQAVARVHRLPFVLDSEFSLRRGSTRGAYELVIQVEEARRFFFDHSLQGYHLAQPLDLDDDIFTNDEQTLAGSFPGLIGVRQFIGRSGVVFAALDSEEGLQLGFTRYDLFGRGIVASVGYSGLAGICCSSEVLPQGLDPAFVSWSWGSASLLSLELGVPLDATDAVRFAWSRRDGLGGSRSEVFGHFRFGERIYSAERSDLTLDRAELKWVRDTSDDPLVPTRGFTLAAGVERSAFETGALEEFQRSEEEPFVYVPVRRPAQESEQIAAVVSGARHWSITPRQTVSGLGRLSIGRSSLRNLPLRDGVLADQDLDVFGGSLGVRHAVRLWQARGDKGFGDLYLESRAELGIDATSPDIQPGRAPNPLERLEMSVGLIFRNAWGRLRILFSYLDVGEVVQ